MADNTTIVLFVAMKGTDAKPYAVRMRLRHNFCWCRDGRPARRPLGPGPARRGRPALHRGVCYSSA